MSLILQPLVVHFVLNFYTSEKCYLTETMPGTIKYVKVDGIIKNGEDCTNVNIATKDNSKDIINNELAIKKNGDDGENVRLYVESKHSSSYKDLNFGNSIILFHSIL